MRLIFFGFLIAFFICTLTIFLTEQTRKEAYEASRSVQSQAKGCESNTKN
jgi:cell division protein FtsI/penicillin-binding protein 2